MPLPSSELPGLVALLRAHEASAVPHTYRLGDSPLTDQIILQTRKGLQNESGEVDYTFIEYLYREGVGVLFLINDLAACRLFGLSTAKGVIEVSVIDAA